MSDEFKRNIFKSAIPRRCCAARTDCTTAVISTGGSAGSRSEARMVSDEGSPLSRYRARRLVQQLNLVSFQQPKHAYKKAEKQHTQIPRPTVYAGQVEPSVVRRRDLHWDAPAKKLPSGGVGSIRSSSGWVGASPDTQLTGRALTNAFQARGRRMTVPMLKHTEISRHK
jgi:putative transposase